MFLFVALFSEAVDRCSRIRAAGVQRLGGPPSGNRAAGQLLAICFPPPPGAAQICTPIGRLQQFFGRRARICVCGRRSSLAASHRAGRALSQRTSFPSAGSPRGKNRVEQGDITLWLAWIEETAARARTARRARTSRLFMPRGASRTSHPFLDHGWPHRTAVDPWRRRIGLGGHYLVAYRRGSCTSPVASPGLQG